MLAFGASSVGNWKDVLRMESNVPVPIVGSSTNGVALTTHQVLIRIVAADLNPVDLQKVAQARKDNASSLFIPGFSGSGIVERVGCLETLTTAATATGATTTTASTLLNDDDDDESRRIQIGDEVIFMTATGGAYAELVVADRRAVAVLPKQEMVVPNSVSFSLAEASVIPLAGCTAYESLLKLQLAPAPLLSDTKDGTNNKILSTTDGVSHGRRRRQRLLIVGAAGGVGSWAMLLAKSFSRNNNEYQQPQHSTDSTTTNATDFSNLEIICTATSEASKTWCTSLGADLVIGHDEIATLGGGPCGSVNAILCLTEPTPSLFKDLSEVICPYGTICCVVAGPSIQSLDAGFLFFKCANLVFETVFTSFRINFDRSGLEPRLIMEEILARIMQGKLLQPLPISPHALNGQDWKQVAEALAAAPMKEQPNGLMDSLASGHTQGKLYMTIGSLTSA